MLTEKDVDEVAVPVQILAPEHDIMFTPELKTYTFEKLQKLSVPFEWMHFPKVEHGCFTRGAEHIPGEREVKQLSPAA